MGSRRGGGGPGEHGRRRPSAAVSRLLPPHRHRRFLCALGDVAEPLVGVTLNPETVRVYAATFCLFSSLSLSLFLVFLPVCVCCLRRGDRSARAAAGSAGAEEAAGLESFGLPSRTAPNGFGAARTVFLICLSVVFHPPWFLNIAPPHRAPPLREIRGELEKQFRSAQRSCGGSLGQKHCGFLK